MDLAQYIDNLKLNSYEKEIIIFLSSTNGATAKEIWKETKVPQGRIYSVLDSLKKKGFVTIIPSNPKKYEIKDIKKALNNYLDSEKDKLNQKINKIKNLELKPKKFSLEKNNPSVNLFTGRDEHLQAIISLRNSAKKEIKQIAPLFVGSFSTNINLERVLKKKINYKIIVRKITSKNKKNIELVIKLRGQVKVLDSDDLLSLLIKDSSEFLLGVQDYKNEEERIVLYSKNKALINSLEKTFDELWKKGKEVTLKSISQK